MLNETNSTLKKYLLFYILWLMLIKLLSVFLATISMHNIVTILLETFVLSLPFVLMVIQTISSFVKACFSGDIKNFSLNYAELAIIISVLFYIGYFYFLQAFVDWSDNELFHIFGLDSNLDITDYSAFKLFLIRYSYSIISSSESFLYLLLLPLCMMLLLVRLKIKRCARQIKLA